MNIKKSIKNKIYKRYFSEYTQDKNKKKGSRAYADFSNFEEEVIERVKPFTMTNPERVVSLIRAIDYIEKNEISGSIVECGVWKGGSMMAAILTLKHKNKIDRDIYLYDTYEGMSEPTEVDKSFHNESAEKAFNSKGRLLESD